MAKPPPLEREHEREQLQRDVERWLAELLKTVSSAPRPLALAVDPLPPAEIEARPLTGAHPIPWELFRLPRFDCRLETKRGRGNSDQKLAEQLEQLINLVQRAIDETWMIGDRAARGYVETSTIGISVSDDERHVVARFALSIDLEA